jgi:hypothetical protein
MNPNESFLFGGPLVASASSLGFAHDGRKIPLHTFLHVNKLTDFQREIISLIFEIDSGPDEYAEAILKIAHHADALKIANWKPNKVDGDAVNRPDHYERFPIEPTFFIMENGINWCLGNVLKYLCRFPFKNGVEDLRKAQRYLAMYVRFLDRKEDWSR